MKTLKKLTSLCLAIIMMLSIFTIAPITVNAAGDSIGAATNYTLGTTVNGSLTTTSRKDVYKFTLSSSGKITLSVNAYIQTSHYYIYDSTGKEIWSSPYEDWNSTTEKMTLTDTLDLTIGTYYFSIHHHLYTGNYNFKITFASANESFKESGNGTNNTISSPNSISLGSTYKGQLALTDRKDFYKFTLSSSGRITLSVNAYIYTSHYRIYDSSGNNVWKETYREWNSTTEKLALNETIDLTSGTYYFSIDHHLYTGNYDFKLSFTSASESFKESGSGTNNTISNPNSISIGTKYKGQLAVNDEKDFYKFTLSSSSLLTLSVNAYINRTDYYIYNASGSEIWKKTYQYWNDASKKLTLSEQLSLSSGTYYFCVSKGSYTGNYDFSISKSLTTPSLKKAENTTSGVKFSWYTVSGASGYYVYRKTSSSSWTKIATVSSSTSAYTDKSAKSGTTYTYTVSAYSGSTTSSYYSGVSIKCLATPGLKKVSNTVKGTKVYWNKATGASGYYVYRKTSSSSWKRIATLSSSASSYIDTKAKSGTTYTYTVKAYSGSTNSSYNKSGVSIKYLTAPKISSAKSSKSGITVKWGKTTGAKGYYVYRKTSSSGWKKIATTSNLYYTDKSAKKGKTYTYTIRAYSGSTRSSYYSGKKCKDVY